MTLPLLKILGGLILLVVGGEFLVRGSSRLASAAKLSPLFIGLTIVAFGTSSPELVVSISTSLRGQPDLSLGNVVGSNIFNVLAILGLSALASPLIVKRQMIRFDVPLMIGVSILLLVLSWGGNLSRIEGICLFAGLLGYTFVAYRNGVNEMKQVGATTDDLELPKTPVTTGQIVLQVLTIVVGLAALIFGCEYFVGGSVEVARLLEVPEVVIGLTILAAGTSLPELATSVVASLKNERDIAVGNIVGSNIFNILCVLGISSAISTDGIHVGPQFLRTEIPIMIATAIVCLPIFITHGGIARWEGLLFVLYYIAYTVFLVLSSTHPELGENFGLAMGVFVVPLTLLGLAVSYYYRRHPVIE